MLARKRGFLNDNAHKWDAGKRPNMLVQVAEEQCECVKKTLILVFHI